jgi:adenylate cyclase
VPPQTAAFFFALNFAAVSTIVYLLLRYSDAKSTRPSSACRKRTAAASRTGSLRTAAAQHPSRPIAERLKNSDQTIADGFAEVSVMFADIVNFTRVAEGLTPQQVFAMLNKIFSCFDELAEKYGLEKIKTIGDAYMVAAGLNDARRQSCRGAGRHGAGDVRLLHHDFSINEMRLELRIGIGTGPVVAGVVGKKKFIYDLWGDTVNIASRVTSEGVPGMVQVDERTYRRLHQCFDFREPQTIYLKGKGNMVVHRLIGRRTPATPSGRGSRPLTAGATRSTPGPGRCWPAQFVAAAFGLSCRVIEPDAETTFGGDRRPQQVGKDLFAERAAAIANAQQRGVGGERDAHLQSAFASDS